MTITEFLLARITEDESAAMAVSDPDISGTIWCAENDGALTTREAREQSVFVTRHSPARVLAECAAKRAIVANSADAQAAYMDDPHWNGFDDCHSGAIQTLAAVYADHSDYLPGWAA